MSDKYRAELFNSSLSSTSHLINIVPERIRNTQDAILAIRLQWHGLESDIRSPKVEGLEPIIDRIELMAATCISVAAGLRAKIKEQEEALKEKAEPILPVRVPSNRKGPGKTTKGKAVVKKPVSRKKVVKPTKRR